ncbi:MAG TPA: NFACT RNA binding domain-containing protein [Candidatus Krumholzibacteria bacterium]|nr:NFACT RNA binding domain-containing protein [Candidatus Krumholzibacteria bacterium]HPD72549.1 NFACT RNA binding domain-containing protein [Candidatus Krumholzibacteria bacterium]HRY40519.1 NFACT RNA binding domain-containing protein [Candidatus Krumholzibacteria bacterium]
MPASPESAARLFRYTLPGGWVVLAGRTDRDNDLLSLKLARPNDWWFHVKGLPGSHVVLQVPSGEEPDRDTVRAAAAVAAWHSRKRAARSVAVTATRARYVTKPRGAPPGTVSIRRETVLQVKPGLPEAAGIRGASADDPG